MEKKVRGNSKQKRPWVFLFGLLVLAALLSMCSGTVFVRPTQVFSALFGGSAGTVQEQIIRLVRLPRTLAALAAGAGLACAGAVIQTVLGNPLASPNIMAVNSGAGFGMVLASSVFPFMTPLSGPVAAFLGAFLGITTVLFVSRKLQASRTTMILCGIAISAVFSAAVDAFVTVYPDVLVGYSDFRIGGLAKVTMPQLTPGACMILLALVAVVMLASYMDVLSLGADVAQSLGVRVQRIRLLLLALAALLAASAVSFAGLIGFVGLIVPHIIRRFFGVEGRVLLVASALGGATFLTLADVVARLIFLPYELPVGIVLAFLGGPFFLFIMFQRRKLVHVGV